MPLLLWVKTDNGYLKDAFVCILTATVKFGIYVLLTLAVGLFKFFRSFFLSFGNVWESLKQILSRSRNVQAFPSDFLWRKGNYSHESDVTSLQNLFTSRP